MTESVRKRLTREHNRRRRDLVPVPLTEKAWVIKDGDVFWLATLSGIRSCAIEHFLEQAVEHPEIFPKTWKDCLRAGYRCVQVEVREVMAGRCLARERPGLGARHRDCTRKRDHPGEHRWGAWRDRP